MKKRMRWTQIPLTKICYVCSEEKGLESFSLHAKMRDGRLNKCKDCASEYTRQHRIRKPEYYKQYEDNRYIDPVRKLNTKKYQEEYRASNQTKLFARSVVNSRIRDGHLERGECFCGETGEAHHEDYSKPLEVTWLCKQHHEMHHRKERADAATLGR